MTAPPRRRALGATIALAANIPAITSVPLNAGAAIGGRVLARNATATLDSKKCEGNVR